MIPRFRIFCYETQEMIVVRDYRELAELFAGLDADDSLYSDPMHSTGLFDKNGKEIFEGDVVNIFGEKLSQIYYSEGAFCVEVLNGGTPLHVYLSEHLEIIGNIYENPELVEGLNEK
ncbi:YopX family protein [Streptococcus suis]|uniref:YopX family protein n=1 Tax=Streptococcus suis TaxID=1307 RepID=UPI003BA23239